MKKNIFVLGAIAISATMLLAAGCGSTEKQTASPANSQPKAQSSMPNDNPAPILKDMDQQLQDIAKQVKNGQVMEAQKTAGTIAGDAEKIVPHLNDQNLKDALHHTAYDLKDAINAAKQDPSVIEGKVKSLQDLTKKAAAQLQGHNH